MQSPVQTTSSEAQELVNELSHDLMSPYCPGRTIATCPSPQARKLENEMLVKAEAGMSREEIETELVGRFPDIQGYIGRPELLWGTALIAVLAIFAIFMSGRRWVRQGRAGLGTDGPGRANPAREASLREIDALEDALDEVDDF